MKARNIFVAVAAVLLFASCEATSTTRNLKSEARVADGRSMVSVIPPAVKIDVDPAKFEDKWTFTSEELEVAGKMVYTVTPAERIEYLETKALQKSALKHGGDVVVMPIVNVDVTTTNGGGKMATTTYTVTVNGYVGKYVDWDKDGIPVPCEQNR